MKSIWRLGEATRWATTAFLFLGITGCAHPSVQYELDQFDDLVVSNSEQLLQTGRRLSNDTVEMTYTLLIANRSGSKIYVLDTQGADFFIGGKDAIKAACTPTEKVTLATGATIKIACSAAIHGFTEEDQRDRTCKFTLPYRTEGTSATGQINQDCRLAVGVSS